MSGDKRARLKQWLESGEARLQPLTFPQRELWETSSVPVADMANHICCLINVRGIITPQECESAVRQVVKRQEALRLSFLPGKEKPVQMIRKTGEANIHVRDLAPSERDPDAMENLAREIFSKPFDLVQGPLYRVEVLRRAADDHVMVLAIHHAIADGWTLGVFVQDLCGAYLQEKMGRSDDLPPVPATYAEWGAAERAYWQPAEIEKRAGFWREHLANRRSLWPTKPTAKTGAPARMMTELPADIATGVRELARRSGTTLFSTLLTVFQIMLAEWTGESDVVVGTPVANRHKQTTRETMGYFSGIVPIRGQVDAGLPFADALRRTHDATVDCFANAIPFAELTTVLGEAPAPGYNPIFQVRFALQNHPVPDVALPGLSAKLRMRSTGTARFDLACEITEMGDLLEVVWLFWPGMFPEEEIRELSRRYESALVRACRVPEGKSAALMTANS